MKRIDYLSIQHAKRFTKDWDYFVISTSSYSAGYKEALSNNVNPDTEVKLESIPGDQQLTARSFEKWKKEKESISLKEALKTFLPWLNFTDLRIEEKNGKISFQGVCKRDQKG